MQRDGVRVAPDLRLRRDPKDENARSPHAEIASFEIAKRGIQELSSEEQNCAKCDLQSNKQLASPESALIPYLMLPPRTRL